MSNKTKSMFLAVLFAVLLVFATWEAALAGLAAVGPTDPQTGFPQWYQDTTGLQLGLCLNNNAFCIQAPVIAGNPTSEASGFGDEAFWFAADALIDDTANSGVTGIVVLAVEAAYAGGDPAPNDQVVFTRVRIRLDVPASGEYIITHPYGTATFNVPALIAGNEINDTQDIGMFPIQGNPRDYAGPLNAAAVVNPFLTWPNFLTDPTLVNPVTGKRYIGNPTVEHIVTGSPTGNNFVRVTGPSVNFTQNLFVVQGEVFAPPPAVVPNAASLTRNASGAGLLEVFFNAPANSTQVTVAGDAPGSLPGEPFVMTAEAGGPPGLVSVFVPIDATTVLPASVTVSVDGVAQTPIPLTDKVNITSTAFANGTLTIAAGSGDQFLTPAPILTVTDPPGLVPNTIDPATGTLTVTGLLAAPAMVTVTSSGGGTKTVPVPFTAGGGGGVVAPPPGTGTPGVAAGVMTVGALPTGTTTVVVGGVSMAITAATTVTINGVVATPADLADGMVVRVEGTIDANGTTGTATVIAAEDILNGTVTAVGVNTLTVLGQTVNFDPLVTVIVDANGAPAAAPMIGDKIQVFGARDNSLAVNGTINASRIVVGATVVVGAGGRAVGPVDAANGFPTFYRDEHGLALGPCLDQVVGMFDPCGLTEAAEPGVFDPTQPIVFPGNFPGEAFYWMAEGLIGGVNDQGNPVSGVLVMAMEAAFLNDAVVDGDQQVFQRLRVRADGLQPNTQYTVDHPFGTETFVTQADGSLNSATDSTNAARLDDLGCEALPCDFSLALVDLPASRPLALPFLPSTLFPAGTPPGFIGNAGSEAIIAGPNGNVFRISGPGLPGGAVEQANFFVVGKIFTDIVKIEGLVEGSVGTTFSIGTLTVDFSGVAPAPLIANGDRVVAEGVVDTLGGTLNARTVTVVPSTPDQLEVVDGDLINAEGFITGFVGLTTHQILTTPFMLGDIPVNTSATTVVLGVPVNGARAMARGSFVAAADAFIADEIIIFGADGDTLIPTFTLSGDEETPPVITTATGTGNLNFDTTTNVLSGTVTFSGLTGPATSAHIHQGAAGVAGGIVIFLTGDLGAMAGTFTVPFGTVLSPALVTALQADQLYVNIHTPSNPGGEIRGQIDFPGEPPPQPVYLAGQATIDIAGHENLGVANATVTIAGTGLTVQTDGNGYFSFDVSDIIPGRYDLIITSGGLDTFVQGVDIAEDQNTHIVDAQLVVATGGYSQEELDQAVATERAKWDANGDGRIGIEEAIRALQVVTGNGGTHGGGGATIPTIHRGEVEAIGSITVNGVRFIDDTATIIADDDPTIVLTKADVEKLGLVVTVRGIRNADGVTGAAAEIEIENEIRGAIMAKGVDTLTVLGQTVITHPETEFEAGETFATLLVGDRVEVHGERSGSTIRASRVDRTLEAVDEIRGTVTAFVPGAAVTVGGTLITVDANTAFDPVGATPVAGDLVEVHFTAGTATLIHMEDELPEGQEVEVEGLVSGFVGLSAIFKVAGTDVDASKAVFAGGFKADMLNGMKLEAEGVMVGGVLMADRIKFKDSVRIQDNASNTLATQVTLLGKTVLRSTLTSPNDAIVDGNGVEVRGFMNGDGSISATRLNVINPVAADKKIIRGPVSAVNAAARTLVVLGITVDASGAGVIFLDNNDDVEFDPAQPTIPAGIFFGLVVPNSTVVKARGTFAANTLTVTEIEIE